MDPCVGGGAALLASLRLGAARTYGTDVDPGTRYAPREALRRCDRDEGDGFSKRAVTRSRVSRRRSARRRRRTRRRAKRQRERLRRLARLGEHLRRRSCRLERSRRFSRGRHLDGFAVRGSFRGDRRGFGSRRRGDPRGDARRAASTPRGVNYARRAVASSRGSNDGTGTEVCPPRR